MKLVNRHRAAVLAATLAGVALAAPGAAPAASNATWKGGAADDLWSTGENWSGGSAPSGSVGVLSLPASSPSCGGWGCNFGVDDISSLTAGRLQIDASNNYLVTPLSTADSIQLTGGLSFGTSAAPASNRLLTKMVVPLALGAGQSWSVNGVPGTPTQLALGAVTGEPFPLTVRMTGGVTLQAAELDTGPLTLSGGGDVVLADQMAQPADDITGFPPPLIGSQGISLTGGASLAFNSPGAVSGPITVTPGSYSTLQLGHGVAPDGTATVDGDVTLRANSTLQMWIDQADPSGQPQPSTDASQLTVFGDLNLNGASLALSQGFTDTQVDCATLSAGQVYTLVSATRLLGSFGGIANGQVVPLGVCNPLTSAPPYVLIISYNTRARPETITATVVGPAQIKALVGRTLIVPPAASTLSSALAAGGYTTTFNAPTAGVLALTWTAVSHHHQVVVATGSNVAGQLGPRSVPIKLTSAGEQLLYAAENPPVPKPKQPKGKKKHRKPKPPPKPKPRPVTITATASFTPTGKSVVTVTGQFTLR